jgi:hypothetical protein
MNETVSDKPVEHLASIELWVGVMKLGSATTLVRGASRPEGLCTDLLLREGLGVEAHFAPRGRAPVKVIIPANNIRCIGLEAP